MSQPFTTPLTGPFRSPAQMLGEQTYDGHVSVHDDEMAADLGLAGAPIEGPTHFSQFDPLAVACWGQAWFETGCISAHFQTMVVEGETVQATLTPDPTVDGFARIDAVKGDGSPVLTGTASLGGAGESELDARLARWRDPGELFIVDVLEVGQRSDGRHEASVDFDTRNGDLYPFSLRQKLERITEPSPWYESADNPWGRPVLPMEMISVLSSKAGGGFAVRGPAVGLFIDLEVRMLAGPVFVDQAYQVEREVVALGQSRRTESHWVRSTLIDADTNEPTAEVLLHSGVFKDSYAEYPRDRLEG